MLVSEEIDATGEEEARNANGAETATANSDVEAGQVIVNVDPSVGRPNVNRLFVSGDRQGAEVRHDHEDSIVDIVRTLLHELDYD